MSKSPKEVQTLFILYANKNLLSVKNIEPVTSGSANIYTARFEFSPDWQGFTKKAVFRAGYVSKTVLLDETGECTIPWEVLEKSGFILYAGVFGAQEDAALPTVWGNLGQILRGVPGNGEGTRPPTPDVWEQELSRKGDGLRYDGIELSLMSGDKPLSKVVIPGSGGGSIVYRFGHGLKQDGLDVSVDAVSDFTGDNTLPMTAAGVQTQVGNIEALLATI